MNADSVRARLEAHAEPAYRDFNQRLIPGKEGILGVRMAPMHRLAKEIAKGDFHAYLADARDDSYEETLLQGLVIGCAKVEMEERQNMIAAFVPKIDNWATCDLFCGALKCVRAAPDGFLPFLLPYLAHADVYGVRFGVVMLLDYYIDAVHIDRVLDALDGVRCPDYYVKMAVAWAVSMCFSPFPEKTLAYLRRCALDDWTYNKALQKIIESRQVDGQTKAAIRAMRRKGARNA